MPHPCLQSHSSCLPRNQRLLRLLGRYLYENHHLGTYPGDDFHLDLSVYLSPSRNDGRRTYRTPPRPVSKCERTLASSTRTPLATRVAFVRPSTLGPRIHTLRRRSLLLGDGPDVASPAHVAQHHNHPSNIRQTLGLVPRDHVRLGLTDTSSSSTSSTPSTTPAILASSAPLAESVPFVHALAVDPIRLSPVYHVLLPASMTIAPKYSELDDRGIRCEDEPTRVLSNVGMSTRSGESLRVLAYGNALVRGGPNDFPSLSESEPRQDPM